MTVWRFARGGAVLLVVLLAACSSSPPAQFYTLTPTAGSGGESLVPAPFVHAIAVGPVSVPEAVNRPQFVVRDGPNRLVVLELQRWAEPLRDGIAESVAGCPEPRPRRRSRDADDAECGEHRATGRIARRAALRHDRRRCRGHRSGMDDQGAQRRPGADHRSAAKRANRRKGRGILTTRSSPQVRALRRRAGEIARRLVRSASN